MLKRVWLAFVMAALVVVLVLAVRRYQTLSDSRPAGAPAEAALIARLDAEARTAGRALSLAVCAGLAAVVASIRRAGRVATAAWIVLAGGAVAGIVCFVMAGENIRRAAELGWTHGEAIQVLRSTHVLFTLAMLSIAAILVLVALHRNALAGPGRQAAALRALLVASLLVPVIVHIFIARPADTADVRETLAYALRAAALRVDVAACLSVLLVAAWLRERSGPAFAEMLSRTS